MMVILQVRAKWGSARVALNSISYGPCAAQQYVVGGLFSFSRNQIQESEIQFGTPVS
jgi:hypothetical protein